MNDRGLMHRDLRPENIQFKVKNNFSSIAIADFGLAT
jgi:serine/threonine protein kinase